MYRLDHLNGPQRGGHRIVQRRRIEAGSDLACSLWAPMDGLAPRHAVLEDDGERVRIRALDGASLRVNGRAVLEAELAEGDAIEIGPMRLRFSRRRRRIRDFRRAIPAAAAALALAAAGGYLYRRQRGADGAGEIETPPFVPPSEGEVAPSLRIMETAAERMETTEAERLERLGVELERERGLAPAGPADGDGSAADADDRETRRRNAVAALTVARLRAEEGRLNEADTILARLQASSPDFLEAFAERARIQERQGRIEDALRQWRAILDAGPAGALHGLAAAETLRLTRLLAPAPPPIPRTPDPSPAPPAVPTPQPTPRLRIVSTEHRRFPATAEYEEMRLLQIVVRAESPLSPAELDAARLDIVFYDIVDGGAAASPTRARTSPSPVYLRDAPRDGQGNWTVTATYTVPRGLRERERRATGRNWRYHGFLVQAFIGGEWQTADARPRNLAERR